MVGAVGVYEVVPSVGTHGSSAYIPTNPASTIPENSHREMRRDSRAASSRSTSSSAVPGCNWRIRRKTHFSKDAKEKNA